MADKPDTNEADEAAPSSGKKKLMVIIVIALVALLILAVAGWFYVSRQHAAELDDDGEEIVQAAGAPKGPPTYLPLDTMVVNLADPGGEKVVQIGVTLELIDNKAPDRVKPYLPAIRNSVLLLVSQSNSEELLKREGKEKLATDILAEASRHFVSGNAKADDKSKKKKSGDKAENEESPIRKVLFFSFIVQ